MQQIIKPLRIFFAVIAPVLFIASAATKYYRPESAWAPIAFAILLASIVGFYTNFIAIKMLFRPSRPTIFGRQGLIPKKQPELAQRLGEGINEHFFNAREIKYYLDNNQLLLRGSDRLKDYLDLALQNPDLQKKLSKWLGNLIEQHTDEIHQFLVKVADQNLPKLIAQNTDLAKIANQIGDYLEENIHSGAIDLEQVVDKFAEIAAENIPDLSRWILEQFENYNASQGVIKRNLINFSKWSNDIDENSIRDQFYYLISTMEFRQAVYDFSERMALSLSDYLETDQGIKQLNHVDEQLNRYLVDSAREEGIPFIIQWIQNWLSTPSAWQAIDRILNKGVDLATTELENYIHSERFNNDMDKGLGRILKHFNIQQFITQKVSQLDSHKLESLVLSATKEHLSAIEVFGGILGGFAGIALFSIPIFMGMVGVSGLLLMVESSMSNKGSK